MAPDLVELRGEVPRKYVDVLDAVVAAQPGASRMSVLRAVLGDWVARKKHEAMLIQRVAGVTGTAPEPGRSRVGVVSP